MKCVALTLALLYYALYIQYDKRQHMVSFNYEL